MPLGCTDTPFWPIYLYPHRTDTCIRIVLGIRYPLWLTYIFKNMMYLRTGTSIVFDTVSISMQLRYALCSLHVCAQLCNFGERTKEKGQDISYIRDINNYHSKRNYNDW